MEGRPLAGTSGSKRKPSIPSNEDEPAWRKEWPWPKLQQSWRSEAHATELPPPPPRTPTSYRLTDLRSTLIFRPAPPQATPRSSSSSDAGAEEDGSEGSSPRSEATEEPPPPPPPPNPVGPPPGPPPPPALFWESPPTPRSYTSLPVGCLASPLEPYAPLGAPDFDLDKLLPRALRLKIKKQQQRLATSEASFRSRSGLESARERKAKEAAAAQAEGKVGESVFRATMLQRAAATAQRATASLVPRPASPRERDASGYRFLRHVWLRSEDVARRVRAGATRREALTSPSPTRASTAFRPPPPGPAGLSPSPSILSLPGEASPPPDSPPEAAAGPPTRSARFARGRGLQIAVEGAGGAPDPSVLAVEAPAAKKEKPKPKGEGEGEEEETEGQRVRRKMREDAVKEGPTAPRPSLFPHQLAHHLPGGPTLLEPPPPLRRTRHTRTAPGALASPGRRRAGRSRSPPEEGPPEEYQEFDVVQREMRKRLLVRMEQLGLVRGDRALRRSLASQLEDRPERPAAPRALSPPHRHPARPPASPTSVARAELASAGGGAARAAELRFLAALERLSRAGGGEAGTVTCDALFAAVERMPPGDLRACPRIRLLVAALVDELGARREFAAFAAERHLPFRVAPP